MFEFPIEAKENIIRTQGENGQVFLDNLSIKFAKYIEKWKLRDCKFLTHSTNMIFECKSDLYGDVIIKAGVPEDGRLLTEISAVELYSKNPYTCKLHDYALDDGFLMYEKLTPGVILKDAVSDPILRTDIFLEIYKDFHLPCDDATYPTYIWLIDWCDNRVSDPNFTKYKEIKKAIYHEISRDYSRKCLLHGDMHFANILSHGDTFKVIDPHGIIGDPIFDISRFLANELADSIREKRPFNNDIVSHISKSLDVPASILYGILFVDVAHHASYHLGNPITKERYEFNFNRCDIAYNLYLSAKEESGCRDLIQ